MAHIPDSHPAPRAPSLARYTAAIEAGYWLVDKARRQAAERGTFTAAQNLRKQGVPVELAVAILGARS